MRRLPLFLRTSHLVQAVSAIVLLACASDPALAQYSLKARRDFRVGQHPVALLAVDFDSDGVTDLVTADEISNYISLMKGFADGTFRQVGTVVAGSKPTGVAFVDVNHDTFPDLVASNWQSSDVTVNTGNGIGGFGTKIRSPVGAVPYAVAVGDWNNDGNIDVATANTTVNTISVLLGNGGGTFSGLVQYTVGTSPAFILSNDFNADGKADLVVVNQGSATVQVWRGDGTGAFTLNTTLSVGAGSNPVWATAADLNLDGRPDLIVALRDTGSLKVYLANTTGGFANPSTLSPGDGPRAVAVDDINKDGKPDLMVGMSLVSGVGQLAVMIGDGLGGFGAPTVVSTGPMPIAVATGDFNRDGNLDVVTASLTGNTISVLQTTTSGAFIVANKIPLASGSFPTAIVAADFDRDGKPDVAAADEAADQIVIAKGDGLGGFAAPTTVSTGNLSAPGALAVVDTNHDGAPDLVVLNGDNTMSVLQNNGSGSFTASNGLSIGVCDGPVAVAAGDIDGNTNPDIVYACEVSYHVCTRRGTGSPGAAAFGAPLCTLVDPNPEGVGLANANFDTLQDIVFTPTTSNWVEIAPSNGFGGFLDYPATFPTGAGPWGVAIGDLNNDGYDDMVIAASLGGVASALLGDGGGAFSFPSIDSPAGESPTAVSLADLNADGILDAAVVNTNANNVSFLLGDGFGNFSKAGDFGTRDLPLAVAAADFNLDGKPDLAVADNYSDTLTILLNQSSLGDPLLTSTVTGPTRTVYRWGLVPGAVYDVIRSNLSAITSGAGTIDLGPVTCLADNLPDTDTAAMADTAVPPLGDVFLYMVRPVVGGVPGLYHVSSSGKPAVPSSGGCF
jgi:hypothetical protein